MTILGRRASKLVSRRNKAKPAVVEIPVGSRDNNGEWSVSSFGGQTYQGTTLPADGKTRQEVLEGRRAVEVRMLWIETTNTDALPPVESPLTNASMVRIDGEEWTVYKIEDFSYQGHIEAVIYRGA